MEITDCKSRVKCELGACKNIATHTIVPEHVGVRGRLFVCDKCLTELYAAIGAQVIPKSVETAKRKSKKESR